ncbi:hypothetical protein KCG44_13930 [Pacificimonas sp. WHA3]|uniref:Lipoprotein n=1 Tax=Pacificimonas pallii TaxID=2827236 RepID=A0ABS6SHZ5_9SPHN|nr:hypothetical protein [Pacificimonas pallii]MBV7257880.1 hypothetical protein [Pacificimonas pallii]
MSNIGVRAGLGHRALAAATLFTQEREMKTIFRSARFHRARFLPVTAALLLCACMPVGEDSPTTNGPVSAAAAQDAFFTRLSALCGQAFGGEVEVDRDAQGRDAGADSPFASGPIIMHVRDCTETMIRIPLHVGNNRSRTWIITKADTGLRLKHDHRHEDGSEDPVTQYGGDTASMGSPARQEFPVDTDSVALFGQQGLAASVRNIWAMEIEPDVRFTYELARPSGRLFRVAFDLGEAAELPPPAWGYADGAADGAR